MRHCVGLAAALLFSTACFVDTPAEEEEEETGGDDDGGDDDRGGSDEADDDADDDDTTGSASTTAMGETLEPDTGDTEGSSTTGPDPDTGDTAGCPAGTLGCPCDAGPCDDELTCIDGQCTNCGDGVVDAPEQCDGPVAGGECLQCQIVCAPTFGDCDRAPENGCEIDLSSETNCGACGHDCLGGACEQTTCQPVDLALSQNQPLGLDVAGDFVFWTNLGAANGAGQVLVHSIEPGGSPPQVIASGLSFPETVVADGSKVYWADTFGDSPEGGIGQANYDGTGLVSQWRTANEAHRVRLLLDSPTHIFALQLFDGPARAAKVLGNTDSVAPANAFGGFYDGVFLYWSDNDLGQIQRADVSMGPPYNVEILVSDQDNAFAVYVHDDIVYWTTDGQDHQGNGTVRSRPIAGGPILDFATDVDQPEDLVVDDTHVYWVEWEADGRVERADHDGNNRVVLAPAFSAGIDHDDTAIYWVDQTDGRIRKLAK